MTYNRLQDGGFELVLKHSEESASDGDMRVGYGPDLDRRSLLTTEVSSINRAIASVGQFWDKNDRLPFPSEGELSIQAFKDPWGNHLHYRLINRSNFEISKATHFFIGDLCTGTNGIPVVQNSKSFFRNNNFSKK